MTTQQELPEVIAQLQERRREQATARGLTARWSKVFGYISIHDPTTGEHHDLSMEDAPAWAKWEAGVRKRLYRARRRDAYDLTSSQMEGIWAAERPVPEEEEGIVEEHQLGD